MKYAEICAGIAACSVAWKKIPGWEALWFSQHDPEHDYKQGPDFPSRVLAHHYPNVPNLGDMLKLHEKETFNTSQPELIVAGTPCSSFSLAGLRGGLADDRGNLALQFCRTLAAKKPRWFLWENVPGVLSSFSDETDSEEEAAFRRGDRSSKQKMGGRRFGYDPEAIVQSSDFARLLEGFSECGYSVCWRIFDSQYFGVPQRRRRLFVVGHLGKDWRPPFAVLFESESLRRDFTPGKEKGKRTPGETTACLDASYARLQGTSGQDLLHGHSTLVTAYGGNNTSGPIEVATALKSDNGQRDFESETFIVDGSVSSIDTRNMEDDREVSGTIQAKGNSLNSLNPVAYNLTLCDSNGRRKDRPNGGLYVNETDQSNALTTGQDAKTLIVEAKQVQWASGGGQIENDTAQALRSNAESNYQFLHLTEKIETQPVIYPIAQITSKECRTNPKSGDPSPALTGDSSRHVVVSSKKKGKNSSFDSVTEENKTHPSLKSRNSQNNIVQAMPLTVLNDQGGSNINVEQSELSPTLRSESHNHEPVVAYGIDRDKNGFEENSGTLQSHGTGGNDHAVSYQHIIRRLTPTECERLQAFPDSYTFIPLKKVSEKSYLKAKDKTRYRFIKDHYYLMAADGPRYKALGNSMTTYVVEWIGKRIDKVDKMLQTLDAKS